MEADITKLGNEIARMERLEDMDAALSQPTSKALTEKPEAAKKDDKTGRASDAYKKAFWAQTRSRNDIAPELRNSLNEGTDSEGG